MLRRIALASFAVAVAFVVACGHQVTPNPTGANNNLSGKIVLTFRTNGNMNFSQYTYAVIVDTCGVGTPYPNVYGTSFNGYSFAFLIGGNSGQAFPVLDQFILTPSQQNSLNPQVVPANPNLESFEPNYENQGNQFQLIFARAQLDNPLGVSQPCPNITPAPSNGSSPSSTPSAAASTGASSAPSASPSPSVSAMPTTAAQVNWYFNFFVLDTAAKTVLDSLGQGGATDNSYDAPAINTQTNSFNAIFKATGGTGGPSDPSAQLAGGEIDNYP
jgi:hypothetical protein